MDEREPMPNWVDVHTDLSLCWSHRSYCRLCHALAYLSFVPILSSPTFTLKLNLWPKSGLTYLQCGIFI